MGVIKKEARLSPRDLDIEGYNTEAIELIARQAELRMGKIYHRAKDKSPIYCMPLSYSVTIANDNILRFTIADIVDDEEFEELRDKYAANFRRTINEFGLFIKQITDNHAKIKGLKGEIDQLYHALKDRTDKLEEQTKAVNQLAETIKQYKKRSRKARRV